MAASDRVPVKRRRRRPTGTGTVLSKELIVAAALELIEAPGGNALTVRRLGAALGCDPSAVYRYFADTDTLLLAVADKLIGDSLAGFTSGEDWVASLRDFAVCVHSSVLRHPRLAAVRASRVTAGPAESRAVDTGIGILLQAGFGPAEAVHHYRMVIDTVLAHAAVDADVRDLSEQQRDQENQVWQEVNSHLPAEQYPNLHQVREHLHLMGGSPFLDTLDALLAHLAVLRREQSPPTS
ncbi:TetR/AcrR family transcriptional regulator [Streptomyces sp. NPDC014991]|uniref:TetR/AcrR family transcriptional regulator n=1 Tax=unclassified Streptomyces TaxID=2593676 RepID=UPI002035540D|nr:TetR/AcrR family transcriptional regulator C-terminal domain-containing protein [Streptomyces sp. Caat 7-52]